MLTTRAANLSACQTQMSRMAASVAWKKLCSSIPQLSRSQTFRPVGKRSEDGLGNRGRGGSTCRQHAWSLEIVMDNVSGKWALITGASSGFGVEFATILA